jgi:uncharacterized protein YndB with AHSA1/START domain
MNRKVVIAPVRKSVTVNTDPAHAFEVFTSGLDRWWPKTHAIGKSPAKAFVIEPFVGGRWFTTCEDGSEVNTGHVLVWEPPHRFVSSWEINAQWQSDAAVASEVEVRFVAAAKGTTIVELEHRSFERLGDVDGASLRDQVDNGWPHLLDLYRTAAGR